MKAFNRNFLVLICLTGGVWAESTSGLDERVLLPFASVEAITNGIKVKLKSPYVISIEGQPTGSKRGVANDVIFMPFGQTTRFSERHSWVVFNSLGAPLSDKGFLIQSFGDLRSVGGKLTESRGILIRKEVSDPPDGETFIVIEDDLAKAEAFLSRQLGIKDVQKPGPIQDKIISSPEPDRGSYSVNSNVSSPEVSPSNEDLAPLHSSKAQKLGGKGVWITLPVILAGVIFGLIKKKKKGCRSRT